MQPQLLYLLGNALVVRMHICIGLQVVHTPVDIVKIVLRFIAQKIDYTLNELSN